MGLIFGRNSSTKHVRIDGDGLGREGGGLACGFEAVHDLLGQEALEALLVDGFHVGFQ